MSDAAARMSDAEANRIIEAAMLQHKQMHAERFTVPDAEGRLIEIPVRLMTADDVQAALAYLNAEMLRLQGEAAPAERLRQAMLDGRLDPRMPRATVWTAMAALNAAEDATEKRARLLREVKDATPDSRDEVEPAFGEALRAFWPYPARPEA